MLWHLERDNLALDGIINVIDGIILIKKFTFVKLCCLLGVTWCYFET